MLLQANDYFELHRLHGCELQIGGSDQWGNIAAGVDLIRRRAAQHVHGLTSPLLVRSDGTKYGKSATGDNLWLSAARMSPYRFYQAWIGVPDQDVRKLLLQLTLLSVSEVEDVVADHGLAPERRAAQRRLAWELTRLVHGADQADAAEEASAVLFSGADPFQVTSASWAVLEAEIPLGCCSRERLARGVVPAELFAELGWAQSRSAARRLLEQGGWQINGRRLLAEETLRTESLLVGRYVLVRRGKNHFHLLVVS